MKINDINRINRINTAYQVQNDMFKSNKKAANKDEVHISAAAKQLLETSRAEQTDRTEKLSALKAQIESGTYHVDAGKVAEKLVPFFKN